MDSAYRVGPNYILQPTSATYKYTTANDLKKMILILEWPWETSWVDVAFLSHVVEVDFLSPPPARSWRQKVDFDLLRRRVGVDVEFLKWTKSVNFDFYASVDEPLQDIHLGASLYYRRMRETHIVHARAQLQFTACLVYVCIPLIVCTSTI